MPEPKSYTAYYKPVPLGFWFYFWAVLLIVVIILNLVRLIWPFSDISDWKDWVSPAANLLIFYSIGERTYKQYKNSKVNHCYITVDDIGIKWRLRKPSHKVKEEEIIVWEDVKRIKIGKEGITIKYMSTYFSDTIPLEDIAEEDRRLLLEALTDQAQQRAIPSEDLMAA
jgi:hypothetical protein